MSRHVLDTSAVLALIFRERGAENVTPVLPGSLMSTVNVSEVFTKLAEKNLLTEQRITDFYQLGIEIAPFDEEQALKAAQLRPVTRSFGLSLGDRCCLALGMMHDASVVTSDRNWKKIKFCQVQTIR